MGRVEFHYLQSLKTRKNKKRYDFCRSRQNIPDMEPTIFEKFKTNARKRSNLNRASLKWEHQLNK